MGPEVIQPELLIQMATQPASAPLPRPPQRDVIQPQPHDADVLNRPNPFFREKRVALHDPATPDTLVFNQTPVVMLFARFLPCGAT